MSVFKSCLGGTGRAFGRVLSRMAVSGRQGIRRIRRLGRRRTARSASTPATSSSQILTSTADKKPSTIIEELGDFGRLPPEMRHCLYGYLPSNDVLNMRRLSTTFKEDVSSFAGININLCGKGQRYKFVKTIGVKSLTINEEMDYRQESRRRKENSTSIRWLHLRLHLRYRKYRFLRASGIDPNMIDDHFNPEEVQELRLKSPGRLKKLYIHLGMISPGDLQYIFHTCPRLEVFDIHFNDHNLGQPGLFTTAASPTLPQGLKTIKIFSNVLFDPQKVISKVGNILSQSNFTQLTNVELLMGYHPYDDGQMHRRHRRLSILAATFIQNHAFSLTNIDIRIKILFNYGIEFQLKFFDHHFRQEPTEHNHDRIKKLELADLDLGDNCYLEDWKQTLTDQQWLTASVLRLDGPNWAHDFRLAMRNCCQTLREIAISNITMPADSPPLNIGDLFQDCYRLEKLDMRCGDQFHPPAYLLRPRVLNITQLPRTLKELHLEYLVLGTDEETEILKQLPRLEKLELGHWTELDTSLAVFLRKISSAFTMRDTNIASFVLTGRSSEFQIGISEMNTLFKDYGGNTHTSSSLYKNDTNGTIMIHWLSLTGYVDIRIW